MARQVMVRLPRRQCLVPILLLVAVGYAATWTRAQESPARLTGQVIDPTGAAVVNAQVTATHLPSGETWQTATDAHGRYRLEGLAPGRYAVRVTAENFRPSSREIALSPGEEATASFGLALAPLVEAVTVTESATTAREQLERVPGGVALIAPTEIQRSRASNLRDVLGLTPGVLAQPRFGADESQLSIRGSGLRNNFHLRGVNLLVNGLPYQDADGFSDFESLDLVATERVEVWKGANALRYGGNTMGGAINFVTHTGETTAPVQLWAQGGSFGFFKGQVSTGGVRGPFSYYVSLSDTELDGYREHSQQGRQRLLSNLGWRINAKTALRLDIIYANVAEKLPGSLTRQEFFSNPRQADPDKVQNDWGRFYNYVRMGLGLHRRLDQRQELSVSLFGQYRSMDHPIFQVLDQDMRSFGAEIHYRFAGELGGRRNRLVVGFTPQLGNTEERRFANLSGQRGSLGALFGTEAENYGLYCENQLDLSMAFTFIAGGRADWAVREFDDRFLADGDRSDRRTFSAFSPKLGFLWRPAEDLQLFGNVSRSYEPPLLQELTSFGAPGFLSLEAQNTWQFEIGTRGHFGDRLEWDVAFFDAEIDNEIINLNLQPFPGAPFTIPSYRNADQTRHLGLEVGTGAQLKRGLLGSSDRLSWRTAYTWSRFRFRRDATFADNFLPGAPRHLVRSEWLYQGPKGFWLAPSVDWSPATYFMDSANTALNDKYAVLNLKAGYDWKTLGVYFEAANLADRLNSGSVQVDNVLGRYFEPSSGRGFYVGARWRY